MATASGGAVPRPPAAKDPILWSAPSHQLLPSQLLTISQLYVDCLHYEESLAY